MTIFRLKLMVWKSVLMASIGIGAVCTSASAQPSAKITYKDAHQSYFASSSDISKLSFTPSSESYAASSAELSFTPTVSFTPAVEPYFTPNVDTVELSFTPSIAPSFTSYETHGDFNFGAIDKQLYPHQRVGSAYHAFGETVMPQHQPDYDVFGGASWYGDQYLGQPTASGELLDAETYTAAHLTLPFNSLVHVTNTDTNQTLLVRINDRGPFSDNNIIDLSKAAALELGMNLEHSFANVRVRYAGPADPMIAWFGDVASVPMETAPTQPFYEPFSEPVSEPFNVQTPTVEYSEPFMDLQTPEFFPVTPEALPVPPKEDDEFITLTIKGPIHMASAIMPSRKG